MAVVRNLMIRIGADFSEARKKLQDAKQDLAKFNRDTEKAAKRGKSSLGKMGEEMEKVRNSVAASLSQLRGSRGIGGVATALGALRPALSNATKGLLGLGAAAGGAGAALGAVGVGVGVLITALAAATIGIYRASQAAVKYEADLGRLQMQLGSNTREFVDWARSLGLARTSAVQMGATYSTLLSSFIRDNDELTESTKQLLQTTRVVASATGRSIEDVMERMRSGLLGNTEAIEDLGIFVNVSMIESTNAFRRFAGDKSWDQLTFQQQQQIRLAAILEQAYARYGDKLQNNVMTKQERLMEQLKDIKLNLSQAFLPIWDAILPALTRLAESIAYVTEQLARFTYWLRGWDYDERTRGAVDFSKGLDRVGDSYDDVADSARAARKELAAFDRLNLIGFDGGSRGSGGGGGTGGTPMPPGGGPGGGWELPPLPAIPRLRLEFDPPHPPDAGIGAVATVVVSVTNEMIAQLRAKWQQLLADMQSQVVTYAPAIQGAYAVMSAGIRATHEADAAATRAAWQNALAGMQADVAAARPPVQSEWYQIRYAARLTVDTMADVAAAWRQKLAEMLSSLKAARPQFESDWYLIRYAARLTVQTVTDVAAAWGQKLGEMLTNLKAARPQFESDWYLTRYAARLTVQTMTDVATAWAQKLAEMLNGIKSFRPSIVSEWGLIQSAARLTIPVMGEVAAAWAQKLAEMLARLKAARPQFESDWYLIRYAARLTVNTVTDVAAAWGQKLGEMLSKLKAARPVMESEWWMIRQAVRLTIPAVTDTQSAWQKAMQAMVSAAASAAANIASAINGAITAINNLRSAMELPKINLPSVSIPQPVQDYFSRTFSAENAKETWDRFVENVKETPNRLESQLALSLLGGGAVKGGQAALKGLAELLKRVGIAVPAFAAGGVVSGPTLAMVGEYPGARTNPEVIAPLSELREMVGDNDEEIIWLQRIVQAIRETANRPVTISRNDIGRASVDYMNDEIRRGRNPLRL